MRIRSETRFYMQTDAQLDDTNNGNERHSNGGTTMSMVEMIQAEVSFAAQYAETQILAAKAMAKSAKKDPTSAKVAKALGYNASAKLAIEDHARAVELAQGMVDAQRRAGF